MANLDIGYNFVEYGHLQINDILSSMEQISIIQFLQLLSRKKQIPPDLVVRGLVDLLHASHDEREVSRMIKTILVDSVNELIVRNPIILFVVQGDLQTWEHPIIKYQGDKILLRPIFGGSLKQVGVHHYHAEINVLS